VSTQHHTRHRSTAVVVGRDAASRTSRSRRHGSLDDLLEFLSHATPLELMEAERCGVYGKVVTQLSQRLGISEYRLLRIIGRAARKSGEVSATSVINGSCGYATLSVAKLLLRAYEVSGNSTSTTSDRFDPARWLGSWLQVPQPSLGGLTAMDLLDTPTGATVVERLLGAIESGAYQ
jgi:hypothetical protein